MVDLVASNDPATEQFGSGDQNLFLKAAGEAVRKFCGWLISPPVVVTDAMFNIGEQGLIMLRSRFVTDVSSVKVGGTVLTPRGRLPMELGRLD